MPTPSNRLGVPFRLVTPTLSGSKGGSLGLADFQPSKETQSQVQGETLPQTDRWRVIEDTDTLSDTPHPNTITRQTDRHK